MVCGELEKTAYLSKTPALIFEVIFESTAHKDRTTKFKIYEQEGVRYYVIVDSKASIAKIYRLQEGCYIKMLDASREVIEFDIGQCLIRFDFAKVWV